MKPEPLLKLHQLSKSFGNVRALKPISLELFPGDILGLVGENGAGKSTLIKLLSGVHQADSGQFVWKGVNRNFANPREALSAGIATIHQELEYAGQISVAENLLLGEPWPRFWWGGVDWRTLHQRAGQQLANFDLSIDTTLAYDELSAAEKQEVVIAGALSRDAQLLILDEPTASLTEPEVKRLFSHLRQLQAAGVAILYVSHRLDEIMSLTNRTAVLRDGELISTYKTVDISSGQLVHDMVGRPLEQVFPHARPAVTGDVALQLDNVSRPELFENISLKLRAGEILGLTGLVGSGRSELARAIFGLYTIESGEMKLLGKNWSPRHPAESLQAGLVYLPEERKNQGLVLDHSLRETVAVGLLDQLSHQGMVSFSQETAVLDAIIQKYDVRTTGPQQPVGELSGGNQQKILIARWLERDPQVIILDEPTRGVDIGAKQAIHTIIDQLAAQGKAVLLISSDLPEVLGMSDRVLVLDRGHISAELRGAKLTEQNVILASSGLYQPAGNSI